jgi:hypothetical protein
MRYEVKALRGNGGLATIALDASLALIEARETLAEKETRSEAQKAPGRMIASLYDGHTPPFALEKSAANFSRPYSKGVRSGERAGLLPRALTRNLDCQADIDQVRGQMISSRLYPPLVIAVGGLLTVAEMMAYAAVRPVSQQALMCEALRMPDVGRRGCKTTLHEANRVTVVSQ